jgi:hypothetical protein
VLLSRAGDFQMVVARKLEGIADIVLVRDFHDAVYGGPVQMAGVIDEAAARRERDRRRLRFEEENYGLFLTGARWENEIAFFRLVRCSRVIEDFPGAQHEE